MRRVVSLWLPRFATDRWIQHRRRSKTAKSTGLPASPLALVHGERGGLNLAAVDAAAVMAGLSPGMPLADARALMPDLRTAQWDARRRC